MSSRQNSVRLKQGGFGLIELLVSISIITMVSAVIIARHSAFNGAVLLRNQAYEVAFAIRQAQLLSVSGSNPNPAEIQQYGVYFDKNLKTYQIFRDDGNREGEYDVDTDTKIGQPGRLDNNFEIGELFYNNNKKTNNLSITFKRPNFDALFKTSASSAYQNSGSSFIDIRQTGTSDNKVGSVRRIEVTSAGQVLVTEY